MDKLAKQFIRERSLFYMYVWDDSERLGYSKWLGYEIKNSLFLKNGIDNKITIWFGEKDIKKMNEAITAKINNIEIMNVFKKAAEKEWCFLEPFISGIKEIDSIETLRKYYKSVVRWWSVMTIIFFVPDFEDIDSEIRKEAMKMRSQTEKYSAAYNNIFEDFFKKYFPQYAKYLYVVSPKDVYNLEKRKFTDREIANLGERLNGYGLFNRKIYPLKYLEENMQKQNVSFKDEQTSKSGIVKGKVAFSGKIQGKVQIILYKKDLKKFKKGRILISDMTDPDFIPAMKKAIAFVTDEGGITCHVAITAREIKKPCIIGTKIATQVLKDGDLVEVDANKGIVKILKRANKK